MEKGRRGVRVELGIEAGGRVRSVRAHWFRIGAEWID